MNEREKILTRLYEKKESANNDVRSAVCALRALDVSTEFLRSVSRRSPPGVTAQRKMIQSEKDRINTTQKAVFSATQRVVSAVSEAVDVKLEFKRECRRSNSDQKTFWGKIFLANEEMAGDRYSRRWEEKIEEEIKDTTLFRNCVDFHAWGTAHNRAPTVEVDECVDWDYYASSYQHPRKWTAVRLRAPLTPRKKLPLGKRELDGIVTLCTNNARTEDEFTLCDATWVRRNGRGHAYLIEQGQILYTDVHNDAYHLASGESVAAAKDALRKRIKRKLRAAELQDERKAKEKKEEEKKEAEKIAQFCAAVKELEITLTKEKINYVDANFARVEMGYCRSGVDAFCAEHLSGRDRATITQIAAICRVQRRRGSYAIASRLRSILQRIVDNPHCVKNTVSPFYAI